MRSLVRSIWFCKYPQLKPQALRVQECSGVLAFLLVTMAMVGSSAGQNTLGNLTQGQPVVAHQTGTSGKTALSSNVSIDASQFEGGDMCARIAAACQSPDTPVPTTIDARGFTGAQVCAPTTVTIMLNSCAGNGGGKLLLGTVTVYADGPAAGAGGHYSDINSSGIGGWPSLSPGRPR
jgi:hypothetical protein